MGLTSLPYIAPATKQLLVQDHIDAAAPMQEYELLFIDAGVDEPEQLLSYLLPGVEAYVLRPDEDPVAQITAVVRATGVVQRIHLVSHGSPGCLHLGQGELSWRNVDDYAEQLRSWFADSEALGMMPSLLLYGCNVALGDAGAELLEKLHRYTGAGVAASKDVTGHASQGGDWELAVRQGDVDAKTVFRPESVADYPFTFSDPILQLASGVDFPPFLFNELALGDADGDGYPDLVISGLETGRATAKFYRNDGAGGLREDSNVSFTGISGGEMAWIDVNGDDYLDLLISGGSSDPNNVLHPSTRLYINDGSGGFREDLNTSLEDLKGSSMAWGDMDNDGDLDLAISGENSSGQYITNLYRNNGSGGFTKEPNTPFDGVTAGSLDWGDVDQDGDLDLVVSGRKSKDSIHFITRLYINNGPEGFSEDKTVPFEGIQSGSLAWGDVDGDNAPDLIVSGQTNSLERVTKLYRNDGTGRFTEDLNAPFDVDGTTAWGDVNGDGALDLVIAGHPPRSFFSGTAKLYINDGKGNFTEDSDVSLQTELYGSLDWGDVDQDGDLDLIISGVNTTRLYINTSPLNEAPILTGDLNATVAEGGSYTLLAEDLGFTDPDDDATDITFTISNLVNGRIQLNGIPAFSFSGTDLANGSVRFVHDASETSVASFEVTVSDGKGGDTPPDSDSFNFTVTPVEGSVPKLATGRRLTQERYGSHETLKFVNLPSNNFEHSDWVIDGDGAGDVVSIDFTVKNLATGDVTDVKDVTSDDITHHGRWGNFDYELELNGRFAGGSYELIAVAEDKLGHQSVSRINRFDVNNGPELHRGMRLDAEIYQSSGTLRFNDFGSAFEHSGWVIDQDGAGDVASIDFKVKNLTTGDVQDVKGVTSDDITAYGRWGNFDYELELAGQFAGGSYELIAVATDQFGAESEAWRDSFTVNSAPELHRGMRLDSEVYQSSDTLRLYDHGSSFEHSGWVIDPEGAGDVASIDFKVTNLDSGFVHDVRDVTSSEITAYGRWGNFDYELELSFLGSGNYELSAVATDQFGAEGSAWRDTFTVAAFPLEG